MSVVTPSDSTNLLSSKVIELVAEHALCRPEELVAETRIGEDLYIVGDDACELLSEFAEKFAVDMSEMNYSTYFPDEVTFDMYYYLAVAKKNRTNSVLKFIRLLESKFWRLFAKNRQYQSLTIHDLIDAAEMGKWKKKANTLSPNIKQKESNRDRPR